MLLFSLELSKGSPTQSKSQSLYNGPRDTHDLSHLSPAYPCDLCPTTHLLFHSSHSTPSMLLHHGLCPCCSLYLDGVLFIWMAFSRIYEQPATSTTLPITFSMFYTPHPIALLLPTLLLLLWAVVTIQTNVAALSGTWLLVDAQYI